MKVLVTGGTGFVGSHTVAALVEAGHEVRLLVRSADRIAPALEPLGVAAPEHAVGDILDRDSVHRALEGCDAVVHAAAVFSLDPRRSAEISRANVEGAEIVLGAAVERGLDPIVHVSTYGAFTDQRRVTVSPDSEPGHPRPPYLRAKADAERIARQHQERGAPVTITYPGSVWGPHDPHLGESCQGAMLTLAYGATLAPAGGLPITDVRDLARLHVAVLEAGRGPRRYVAPADVIPFGEYVRIMAEVTGRRLPSVALPPVMVLPMLRVTDWLQAHLPVRLPLKYGQVYTIACDARWDDSATRAEFGLEPRNAYDSLRDTLVWLYEQGHISAKRAGRLAEVRSAA